MYATQSVIWSKQSSLELLRRELNVDIQKRPKHLMT